MSRPMTGPPAPGPPLEGDTLVRARPAALRDAGRVGDTVLAATVGAAVAAAVLALAGTLTAAPGGPLSAATVAVFALLAVVAEATAGTVAGRTTLSWTIAPLVGVAMAPEADLLTVVVVAVLAGLGGSVVRGVGPRQLGFNTAVFVLSSLAAAVASMAVGFPAPAGLGAAASDVFGFVAAGLAGAAAFTVVDSCLVAVALAAGRAFSPLAVWRDDLMALVPHQVGLGAAGGLLALIHGQLGAAATVAAAVPVAGVHVATRGVVRRSTRTVARLRDHNEGLAATTERLTTARDDLRDELEQVRRSDLRTLTRLAELVEHRHGYAPGPAATPPATNGAEPPGPSRGDRLVANGRQVLRALHPGLADDEHLLWGFRVCDVGLAALPDELLQASRSLQADEWEQVRRHPRLGAELVGDDPALARARRVVLHHHEHWDGGGYPFGLAGQAIPAGARVLAVVGAFDAMTSDRPHRPAMTVDEAIRELVREQGSQFDPEVVDAFLGLPRERLQPGTGAG